MGSALPALPVVPTGPSLGSCTNVGVYLHPQVQAPPSLHQTIPYCCGLLYKVAGSSSGVHPFFMSQMGALRKLFVTHGLPDTIVIDKGMEFTSSEFQEFSMRNRINTSNLCPSTLRSMVEPGKDKDLTGVLCHRVCPLKQPFSSELIFVV